MERPEVMQPPTKIKWWYPAIADWMLRHPDGSMVQCALDLGRHINTIRIITSSDTFKEFYAQRRQEWQERHDFALRDRLNRVAEKSLDLILDGIDKKGDKIPFKHVTELAVSALDRLGYAPAPQGGPNVSVSVGEQKHVTIAVTADALAEAREAMRAAEQKRAIESREKLLELAPGGSGANAEVEQAEEA